jgi:hypothetical protein
MEIKNKKGDVPVTILVLGVVVVFISAILSFSFSSFIFKKGFDFKAIESAKILKEKYFVYKEIGLDEKEIENILKSFLKEDLQGKFIEVEDQDIKVRYYLKE